jgi:hypothetical protein
MSDLITIAILAKDKAHTLPLFLKCLEEQTYDKSKIIIYIRSNNNNDDTISILKKWVEKVRSIYLDIYEDYEDVSENVQDYGQHEWNSLRFRVLGKIRNNSISYAISRNTNYFVVDCDNFIFPNTLQLLFNTKLDIVGPLLTSKTNYSNYHSEVTSNGYFKECPSYYTILNRVIKGLISVDVIHCTYFIRNQVLDKINYFDGSDRYEYVIFSDNCRKNKILQFIDTREEYGRITFGENEKQLLDEPWYSLFI